MGIPDDFEDLLDFRQLDRWLQAGPGFTVHDGSTTFDTSKWNVLIKDLEDLYKRMVKLETFHEERHQHHQAKRGQVNRAQSEISSLIKALKSVQKMVSTGIEPMR